MSAIGTRGALEGTSREQWNTGNASISAGLVVVVVVVVVVVMVLLLLLAIVIVVVTAAFKHHPH